MLLERKAHAARRQAAEFNERIFSSEYAIALMSPASIGPTLGSSVPTGGPAVEVPEMSNEVLTEFAKQVCLGLAMSDPMCGGYYLARRMTMDNFDQAVEQYHAALLEFVKGNPEPQRQMFSEREDVVLCNPFRPFAHGPSEVAETLKQAASHFADGDCAFQMIERHLTAELGYIIEIERFRAKLDGNDGSGALRVTTILRPEDGGWRVAHRHADPITTPQATESILRK